MWKADEEKEEEEDAVDLLFLPRRREDISRPWSIAVVNSLCLCPFFSANRRHGGSGRRVLAKGL